MVCRGYADRPRRDSCRGVKAFLFALRADYGNINSYVAAAFLVGAWALGRAVPRRVLWVLLLPVLLYDLWYGYRDVFSGLTSRLSGWADNPNAFADTLLPLLGITGGAALFFRGIRRRVACGLFVLSSVVFVLTGSRAGLVGALVIGLLFLYLRVFRRHIARLSLWQHIGAGGAVLLLAAGCFYSLYRLRRTRPGAACSCTASVPPPSRSIRQAKVLSSFSHKYPLDQAAYFARHPDSPYAYYASDTRSCFNELLQVGYELGWAGIALFVVSPMVSAAYSPAGPSGASRVESRAGRNALASMFAYPLRSYPSAALYALFFGLMLSYDRRPLFYPENP